MSILEYDRKKIRESAHFLEKKGYVVTETQYSIKYHLNNICLNVLYPPNSNESEIDIKFIDKNNFFSVSWIAFVREGIHVEKGNVEYGARLLNVIMLLRYIENHYYQVTNYDFCLESNELINKYVLEHQTKFEKVVTDFLKNNSERT